jgi:hypothetical protein
MPKHSIVSIFPYSNVRLVFLNVTGWTILCQLEFALLKLWVDHAREDASQIYWALLGVLYPHVPTRFPHNSEVALNKGHLVALFLEKLVEENHCKNASIVKFVESEMKCKSLGIHCLFKEGFL